VPFSPGSRRRTREPAVGEHLRETWRIEDAGGLILIRCEPLLEAPGVAHAFSTRRADGRAEFDVGGVGAPDPEAAGRRARFLRAAGIAATCPAILKQVHGARIVLARAEGEVQEADGGIWFRDGRSAAPSVRSADCVPILLVDREGKAAAAVHAGWRGTAASIVVRAVEHLGGGGVSPGRIVAALGPAIRPCCYKVGRDVAEAVLAATGRNLESENHRAGGIRVDLQEANRAQLVLAGVPTDAIHAAPWCTGCRPDLFFSYRRDGAGAGRTMASVGPAVCREAENPEETQPS